jgi:hypothetical protein
MANLILRPKKSAVLPDNAQWKNRFQIHSETSDNVYTIAQKKSSGFWGCDCPGWIRHKNCKHLQNLGLPCYCVPFEATLKAGE